MPTNEERREVAERLRMLDASEWSCYGQEFDAIMDACGCYAGQDQQDVELKDRLADLIEPEERTCNVKHWNNSSGVAFTHGECSECGGYLLENIHMQKPRPYCPHCGAKVVQE